MAKLGAKVEDSEMTERWVRKRPDNVETDELMNCGISFRPEL